MAADAGAGNVEEVDLPLREGPVQQGAILIPAACLPPDTIKASLMLTSASPKSSK
jgi:hypothetical protein